MLSDTDLPLCTSNQEKESKNTQSNQYNNVAFAFNVVPLLIFFIYVFIYELVINLNLVYNNNTFRTSIV